MKKEGKERGQNEVAKRSKKTPPLTPIQEGNGCRYKGVLVPVTPYRWTS